MEDENTSSGTSRATAAARRRAVEEREAAAMTGGGAGVEETKAGDVTVSSTAAGSPPRAEDQPKRLSNAEMKAATPLVDLEQLETAFSKVAAAKKAVSGVMYTKVKSGEDWVAVRSMIVAALRNIRGMNAVLVEGAIAS